MAYYTSSALVNAQAKLTGAFQAGELRERVPATFLQLVRSGSFMFPDALTLKTRDDRTIETKYLLRSSRSLSSGRAHNHTGNRGDSGTMNLSWTTYSDPFSISIKQADNNLYSYEEMLNNEIMNSVKNFSKGLESAASAFLFNNRSGVSLPASYATFNSTNDVNEIGTALQDRAMQIALSAMDDNNYTGEMVVYCDAVAYADFQFYAMQGSSNDTNLSFQFEGATFVKSTGLNSLASTLGYTKGFWIIAPIGTVGALSWIPKQNREGVDTDLYHYKSLMNPIDGLDYALHIYETGADNSLYGGYTQDVTLQHELSVDICFENAPLSVSTETTIQAFGLVDATALP